MAINPQIPAQGLEFRGRMMALAVARLSLPHLDVLEGQLKTQLARSPGFFSGMPLLLELAHEDIDLPAVVGLLRRHGLLPVAVCQPSVKQAQAAQEAGLGVIDEKRGPRETLAGTTPKMNARTATRIVTQPVRSGQQIYARDGDLIVMTSVGAGAEVLADGCIHIYGALRGRALAGVQGDTSARVFCQQMHAELVSVAGCYKISEDIREPVRGKAVQVFLEGESLKFETL